MSISNPKIENPCQKFIEFKGDKGQFFYYDKELEEHPVGTTSDFVMASWFAREAARACIVKPEEDQGDVITMEDMGVEPVKIGEY